MHNHATHQQVIILRQDKHGDGMKQRQKWDE